MSFIGKGSMIVERKLLRLIFSMLLVPLVVKTPLGRNIGKP